MLRRSITARLEEWKNSSKRLPLVIRGVRQCGKTFVVRDFVQKYYDGYLFCDFVQDPRLHDLFDGPLIVDEILLGLSSLYKDVRFESGKTCIVFDEIQECPAARTALKYFAMDGRFDVIATGSLLGVRGYGKKTSIPVGYEEIIDMYPLDFEEFLWANGINEEIIDRLRECAANETPVPKVIHERMNAIFLKYIITGGMPAAVNELIESSNFDLVRKVQQTIIDEYMDDMVKYADASNKGRIRDCFVSIPRQLAKENKKFQYSLVPGKARSSTHQGSLQWLIDAGIVLRCNNLIITGLPLDLNAMDDCFKIYMADTGLFVSMLEKNTQYDILQGNLSASKGAIYENIMADILGKKGRPLFYYHKESGLEVDFVQRVNGECLLIEVKSQGGRAKSSQTILGNPDKYGRCSCIKFGNYNIGRPSDNYPMLTMPLYMAFLAF